MTGIRCCLFAALAFCAVVAAPVRAGADSVLVFAAASLKTALDELAGAYEEETGTQITVSYAASSVLARQIELGAPAGLFISANEAWMDELQNDQLIDPASRINLLSNGLVLIGTQGTGAIEFGPGFDLRAGLNGGYLAMALVDAVPAGIYGKAALQGLGLWEGVRPQVAQADNVRAALALVAAGAAPMGIVYRTDAQAEERVQVLAPIPSNLHPQIIYPAALTRTAGPEAQRFLTYLQTDQAKAEFLRQGFSLPDG